MEFSRLAERLGIVQRLLRQRQPQGGAAEQRRLPVRVAAPVHAGQPGVRLPALDVPPGPQHVDHRLHVRRYLGHAVHRQGRDHGGLRLGRLWLRQHSPVLHLTRHGFLPDQLLAT